jgi:hypothetical protein
MKTGGRENMDDSIFTLPSTTFSLFPDCYQFVDTSQALVNFVVSTNKPRRRPVKKLFYSLISIFLLWLIPATAEARSTKNECDELCMLYKHAKPRAPHPSKKSLVCVNFILPLEGSRKVTLIVNRGKTEVIRDAKEVRLRQGQFCYPTDRWMRGGGMPDDVYLCSEHSVSLIGQAEIDPILSGRGNRSPALACLLGVEGCGGPGHPSVLAH